MATSSCAATSSRFVASSSYRVRAKRTLAMNHPLAMNATKIGARSPLRNEYGGSSCRSMARGNSEKSLPTWVLGGVRSELPSAAKYWLEYLRMHEHYWQEAPIQSRKKMSTMMACALCFLASAASATTGSQSSEGQNAPAKYNSGGGGLGPRKTTQPIFVFSKQKAEEEVRKVECDAREDPYLVSGDLWI
jgi:hypothetical protein